MTGFRRGAVERLPGSPHPFGVDLDVPNQAREDGCVLVLLRVELGAQQVRDEQTQPADPSLTLGFDRDLLERVDAAAKRRGISRSARVQYTLGRALDTGEG